MSTHKQIKVLIIIVLYKTKLDKSLSYKSLNSSLLDYDNVIFEKLIFNNSSSIHIEDIEGLEIVNSAENQKLNGAYNHALQIANKIDADWILLLDQDTELTKDYFEKLTDFLLSNKDKDIVNVVPRLVSGKQHISPHRLSFFQTIRKETVETGTYNQHLVALNSVSLHRVSFLNNIGGFSSLFPLDLLDYWVSYRVYSAKKKIYLLDVSLSHDLSVLNFENNMSVERYEGLLKAERNYMKPMRPADKLFFKFRLCYRYIKQFILFEKKEYAQLTRKSIFNKL